MKCKYCNGTGYNDTQRGTVMTEFPPCPWCGGSGYVKDIEQTNDEWFCQLPTTEKSEFLSAMVKEAIEVHEKHGTTWHEAVSWWDGWLKEIHHDIR